MTEQQACTLCGAGGHTAPGIIINGHQLRNALEFLAPDNSSEQLGEDLVIELHAKDEDFPVAGLYAYHNECPEEGAIFLDDTAQHPEQAEGAQGEQELDFTHLSRRMLEELARLGKCLVATADLERLTQERDVAQARVAELAQALRHLLHNIKASGKRIDLGLAKECAEDALAGVDTAPVAQAGQVPPGWYHDAPSQVEAVIIDIRGMWGEDDCPTYEEVAAALRRMLAAAPAQGE